MENPISPRLQRLKLHRKLFQWSREGHEAAHALGAAWAEGNDKDFLGRSLHWLRDLERHLPHIVTIGEVEEDESLSEMALLRLARATAISCHGYMALKHEERRSSRGREVQLHPFVFAEERAYLRLLRQSRAASAVGSIEALAGVLREGTMRCRVEMSHLLRQVAASSPESRSRHGSSLRAAALVRRHALLAAATLHLMFRLTNRRKAAGLAQVASRRGLTSRAATRHRAAPASIAQAAAGETLRLLTVAGPLRWVGPPEDGHTEILLDAGAVREARIRRRNALRSGLSQGCRIWVEGKIEVIDDAPVLIVATAGPSSHSNEVWEDYLAQQCRSIYDLHPRSLAIEWDLPELKRLGARNDLIGRL